MERSTMQQVFDNVRFNVPWYRRKWVRRSAKALNLFFVAAGVYWLLFDRH